MLKKKLLDPSRCAKCKGSVSLAQINGKTLQVEVTAAFIGGSLIVLEIHRCGGPPEPTPPPAPPRSPTRRVI